MKNPISARLAAIVSALPLRPGMRVLEIGCGPGAAAREIAGRIGSGFVLATDRSAKAIEAARLSCADEIASGRMQLRQVAAEELAPMADDLPFDLAFAVRVGALDGRFPAAGRLAIPRIRAMLVPGAKLFVDGGSPLREVAFD